MNRAACLIVGILSVCTTASAQTGVWTTKAPMPEPRDGMVAGVMSGRVHIVGGRSPADRHQVYDPATNIWSPRTSQAMRSHGAGAVIAGKLYVAGGCGDGGHGGTDCSAATTNRLEVYDPATDTWTALASMPTARNSIGAAAVNGKLYVVGGEGNCLPCSQQFATLEIYDPATNAWTTGPSMSMARLFPVVAAIGDRLFVSGGFIRVNGSLNYTSVADLEVYDTATGTWQMKAPQPTARGYGGGAVINGRLHVVGGSDGSTLLRVHEVYDPATNVWVSDAPLPTPRGGFGAAAVGTTMYVASGYDGPGLTARVDAFSVGGFPVSVDVKPGSDQNTINLGGAGVIPVGILSTPTFNAPLEVDTMSLSFAGAAVRVAGRTHHAQCTSRDTNADGLDDLVCDFNNDLAAEPGDSVAVLEGRTHAGVSIRGQDSIRIVP